MPRRLFLKGLPGEKKKKFIKVIAGQSDLQLRSKKMRMEDALGSSDPMAQNHPGLLRRDVQSLEWLWGLGVKVQTQRYR